MKGYAEAGPEKIQRIFSGSRIERKDPADLSASRGSRTDGFLQKPEWIAPRVFAPSREGLRRTLGYAGAPLQTPPKGFALWNPFLRLRAQDSAELTCGGLYKIRFSIIIVMI